MQPPVAGFAARLGGEQTGMARGAMQMVAGGLGKVFGTQRIGRARLCVVDGLVEEAAEKIRRAEGNQPAEGAFGVAGCRGQIRDKVSARWIPIRGTG